MADNPFESMLPYQQTSAYKTRVLEIARLMMEHQRGITLQDVADKLQQEMEVKIKSLFQLHRSPDLVSSKFLYLCTWASCLKLYNPGESPSFLASSCGRYLPTRFLPRRSSQLPPGERAQVRVIEPVGLPSGPLDRVQSIPRSSILEERQRTTKQEWQVIKSKVVEDLPPPVVTQIPSNDTPKPSSNKPSASNTPASPAITKPEGNDTPKKDGRDQENGQVFDRTHP